MEGETASNRRDPWNKGKLVGQKALFKSKEIWTIRVRLQKGRKGRELALFNLKIDSKLRASMRRTKASLIYKRTKNPRAVQLLLGHSKRTKPFSATYSQSVWPTVATAWTRHPTVLKHFRSVRHYPRTRHKGLFPRPGKSRVRSLIQSRLPQVEKLRRLKQEL